MKKITTDLLTATLERYTATMLHGLHFRLPFPEKIAEYLTENGALISPVKMGEPVYIPIPSADDEPATIKTATVDGLTFTTEKISVINGGIAFALGSDCFLSYTEAEKALEKMQVNKAPKPKKPRKPKKTA